MAGVDDHRLGKPFDHLVRGEVGGAVGIFQNLIVPVGVQLREHAGALVPVGEDGLVVVQGGVIQKLHTQGEIVGGSRPQGDGGGQAGAGAVAAYGYPLGVRVPGGALLKHPFYNGVALLEGGGEGVIPGDGVVDVHHDPPDPCRHAGAVQVVVVVLGEHEAAAVHVDVNRAVVRAVQGGGDDQADGSRGGLKGEGKLLLLYFVQEGLVLFRDDPGDIPVCAGALQHLAVFFFLMLCQRHSSYLLCVYPYTG